MPDVPVLGFVLWRDAKDNPPKVEKSAWYPTDIGPCYYGEAIGMWLATGGRPKPSVWCDPSPPDGDNPLTAHDLQRVLVAAEAWGRAVNWLDTPGKKWHEDAVARLRRALDQIGTNERKDDTP